MKLSWWNWWNCSRRKLFFFTKLWSRFVLLFCFFCCQGVFYAFGFQSLEQNSRPTSASIRRHFLLITISMFSEKLKKISFFHISVQKLIAISLCRPNGFSKWIIRPHSLCFTRKRKRRHRTPRRDKFLLFFLFLFLFLFLFHFLFSSSSSSSESSSSPPSPWSCSVIGWHSKRLFQVFILIITELLLSTWPYLCWTRVLLLFIQPFTILARFGIILPSCQRIPITPLSQALVSICTGCINSRILLV